MRRMGNIDITNIAHQDPVTLASWVSSYLLDDEIPETGGMLDLPLSLNMLARCGNKLSLCTEFYSMLVAVKSNFAITKKDPEYKEMAAKEILSLSANIDMLYRCIQTIEAKREIISRMMTGVNAIGRMHGQ